MRLPFRTFLKGRHGNAATEFALILPIMLIFIGGIVEFGRALEAYNTVNRLAMRYAITYADCFDNPSGTCNNILGELAIFSSATAMQNIVPQLRPTPVPRMFEVVMSNASPAVPSVVYYTVAGGLTASEIAQAQAAIGPGQYGVVVTVTYQFTPVLLASFVPASLARSISYTVAQRKN